MFAIEAPGTDLRSLWPTYNLRVAVGVCYPGTEGQRQDVQTASPRLSSRPVRDSDSKKQVERRRPLVFTRAPPTAIYTRVKHDE